MGLTIEQIQSLDRAALNRMTSESYREEMEGSNAESFKARVDVIENSPRQATRPAGNVRAEAPTKVSNDFASDPSWADESPAGSTPVSVEAPVAVPSEEELPELVHEFQPVDKAGRPVGGKQVFKYRTQKELIEKLTKAHSAASARIRELSRNHKLEEIVASGKSPAALSTDVPQTKDELAKELVETRHEAFLARVQMALAEFKSSKVWQPYQSTENAETLVLAVQKSGDDPRDPASFHKAFETMKQFLVPVTTETSVSTLAPAPVVEQPAAAAAATAPAAAATAPAAQRVAIATGLSATDQFSSEAPSFESSTNAPVGIVVGGTRITSIALWDKVPSDTQKRVLRNPANARIVDNLYAQQAEERLARRGR